MFSDLTVARRSSSVTSYGTVNELIGRSMDTDEVLSGVKMSDNLLEDFYLEMFAPDCYLQIPFGHHCFLTH